MIYRCTNCGSTEVKGDFKICPTCGKPLEWDKIVPPSKPSSPPPLPPSSESSTQAPMSSVKSYSTVKVVMIGGIPILLLLSGAFFILHSNKLLSSNNQNNSLINSAKLDLSNNVNSQSTPLEKLRKQRYKRYAEACDQLLQDWIKIENSHKLLSQTLRMIYSSPDGMTTIMEKYKEQKEITANKEIEFYELQIGYMKAMSEAKNSFTSNESDTLYCNNIAMVAKESRIGLEKFLNSARQDYNAVVDLEAREEAAQDSIKKQKVENCMSLIDFGMSLSENYTNQKPEIKNFDTHNYDFYSDGKTEVYCVNLTYPGKSSGKGRLAFLKTTDPTIELPYKIRVGDDEALVQTKLKEINESASTADVQVYRAPARIRYVVTGQNPKECTLWLDDNHKIASVAWVYGDFFGAQY